MQAAVMPSDRRHVKQAVAGVVAPQIAEGLIRQVWPSVTAWPALAQLAERMMRTIFLAPLAWLLLAGPYFLKILPFLGRRYTLTNRRLMIRTPVKGVVKQEVALEAIDDVRLEEGSYSHFYRSGNLEVFTGDKVVLRLPGVPEPESFRRAILNSSQAWAPKKTS